MGKIQSKIVNMKTNVRFVVRAIMAQYAENSTGNPIEKKYACIKIKNEDTKVDIIHPLSTEFLLDNWKNAQFNTMKAPADTLAMFLNFLISDEDNKVKSLTELKSEHAINFLSELSYKRTSKNTVKKHEKYIKRFFEFLNKKKIINHSLEVKNVQYFYKASKPRMHKLPEEYILTFLEIAYQTDSKILFGLYLQFFGGLRTGELCNLRIRDLQLIGDKGEYGFIVDLSEDRNLRKDIVNTSGSSYIKTKRRQIVFGFKNWSTIFYEKHMNNFRDDMKLSGETPLFLNQKGLAMTGNNYYYHFNRIKDIFLQCLRDSDNMADRNNALVLESELWSSHIGRGIFSNLLAEEADNLYDVSFPRGDKSFESVKPYLANTKRIKEKLEKKIDEIYKKK
ncbi:hypothetical protein CD30_11060 [Ureibacillus massiliensis 4400831 = CIP 108448 = CCUG 49529]|uniref:Core-binding (CB) domain-containing protein n=1 Tax=Ureibacillus massiliensis 4400831 = CIP 108448 = CCUG 49529 TaxID=1211035 RepID=A0A0A3J0D0_9BACL|nr:site-specific integrase [Ureibacillus massiliensis]KGR90474.1 hypothetical protein CD30_11060 [Ureibacillus massiliensis 4400831 = CIP 108448 = CCUG 49529]